MEIVSSQTFTAQTSITASGLSAGRYKVFISMTQNDSTANQFFRFNGDTGANYNYGAGYAQPGGMSYGGATGQTSINTSFGGMSATGDGYFDWSFSTEHNTAAKVSMTGLTSTQNGTYCYWGGGRYVGASSISSITFYTSAGTMTGVMTVYKLN